MADLRRLLSQFVADFDAAVNTVPDADMQVRPPQSRPPTRGEVLSRFLADLGREIGYVPGLDQVERAAQDFASGAVDLPDGMTAERVEIMVEELRGLPADISDAIDQLVASAALVEDTHEHQRRLDAMERARTEAAREGRPVVMPVYKAPVRRLTAAKAIIDLKTRVDGLLIAAGGTRMQEDVGLDLKGYLPDPECDGATRDDVRKLFQALYDLGSALEDHGDDFHHLARVLERLNQASNVFGLGEDFPPFSEALITLLRSAPCPAP